MKPAAAVLLTSLLCATISCRQTSLPAKADPSLHQTSAPGKADPSLTYEVVSKDPAKYAGKRVAWTGKDIFDEITRNAAGTEHSYRTGFLVTSVDSDIHMFAVIGEGEGPEETAVAQKLSHTPGDPNIRKVTGTISKTTTEFRNQPGGTLITAVVLTDAVVDAPDPEPKK